jgi:hypothetical protein
VTGPLATINVLPGTYSATSPSRAPGSTSSRGRTCAAIASSAPASCRPAASGSASRTPWGFAEATTLSDPEALSGNLFEGNVRGPYLTEGQTTVAIEALGDNFAGDPLFVNVAQAGNLRLRAGSAAVDRGDPAHTLPADQDGTVRPQGAGPDCGAFEALP